MQFVLYLAREAGDSLILEFRRNRPTLGVPQTTDLLLLLGDVAAVLHLGLHRFEDASDRLLAEHLPEKRQEFADANFRPLEQLSVSMTVEGLAQTGDLRLLALEHRPALIGNQAGR